LHRPRPKAPLTGTPRARKIAGWAAAPPTQPRPRSIYGLSHPGRPGIPRYVGQAAVPLKQRLGQHLGLARGQSRCWHVPVYKWIRKLLRSGRAPTITAIERVRAGRLDDRERYWIARLRQEGHRLLNVLPGGVRKPGEPSPAAGKKWSFASRRARSILMRERWRDPQIRARIIRGRNLAGRNHSPATRRKMALAGRRAWADPRRRKEQSRIVRARSTPAYRRKLSRANKLAWRRRRRKAGR
jgi:hypothetical protein